MNEQNRNKGFTLIEIIVTIAIMGIVAASSMSIYSWIKFHRMKSMAGNINDAISDTRSLEMTKEGTYELVISKDTNEFIAKLYKNHGASDERVMETYTIGKSGSIWCTDKADGATTYKVEDGNEICIAFNKADGRFSKMTMKLASGGEVQITGYINVSYASLSRKIKLIELTGKHYIE